MNPRASDRVRGFQDTIITVGDIRFAVTVGETLGAGIIIIVCGVRIIILYLRSSLVKRIVLLMLPGPAKFTGVILTLYGTPSPEIKVKHYWFNLIYLTEVGCC